MTSHHKAGDEILLLASLASPSSAGLLTLHTCCFHSGLMLRQYFHTMFFMHSSRRSSEA